MAVWAVIVFGGLAASLGIFVANESMTWAASGSRREYASDWNWNTESVLYFENGLQGAAAQNGNGNTPIKYWQPIDQRYGLGYMNFSAKARGIDHICSAVIFTATYGSNKVNLNLDPKEDNVLYILPKIKYEEPHGGSREGEHKERMCIFKTAETKDNTKIARDDTHFIDHLGGAQSLGQRYDVREYVTSAYGKGKKGDESADGDCPTIRVKGVNNSTMNNVIGTPDRPLNNNRPYASLNRQCRGATILEFHFYPQHTLAYIDQALKFVNLTYRRKYHYKSWYSYSCGTEENPRTCYDYYYRESYLSSEKYNVYIGRNDPTSITYECPTMFETGYDGHTYHSFSTDDLKDCLDGTFQKYYQTSYNQIKDINPVNEVDANGKIIRALTVYPRGSVYYGSDPNSRPYIPHEIYNQYLRIQENKVKVPGLPQGEFDGFLAVDDIDGHNEGYTPLKGVNRVFLSYNTRIGRTTIPSMFKPQRWLSLYNCSSSNLFCSKEWFKASTTKDSHSEDKSTSIYMQYASTPDNPLTLAYYTNGHASGIDSDGIPILYVVEDIQGYSDSDGSLVKTLKEKLEMYKKQFREIYGEELSMTVDILKGKVQNPLTGETKASMPDNFVVNENTVLIYFEAERGAQYDPYTISREILGDSSYEIPWYRDPALKDYIEPGTTDILGAKTNKEWQNKNVSVYFTKISRIVDDYQNTCYSNNISTN